jgi:hypothetical protein
MRKLCFLAPAACLVIAFSPTAFAQPKVEEVVLGPASGQSYSSPIPHLSKTGLHVGIKVPKGSRFAMRVDGVDGPTIDDVMQGFVFSTNGRRHAYVAKVGDEHIVVLDGKEVARARPHRNGTFPFRDLGFSPQGTHFYYQQLMPPEGVPYRWVIDGKPEETHAGVETPVFSPDETRYFYWALLPDGSTKKLIVDGKNSGFPGEDPQFSPDGRNIVTIVRGEKESALFINGRQGSRARLIFKAYMSTGGLNLLVLGTGREGGNMQYLGASGKKIEGSDCRTIESVTFSPDGKHYAALCAVDGGRKFMLIDGKKHQDYEGITEFTFTPDSARSIYVGRSGGKFFPVVNGEEYEAYPNTQGLILGAGGKRVGFLGSSPMSRDVFVALDGKTTATIKNATYLGFSSDASRYALTAGDPALATLYLDGVEQKDVGIIATSGLKNREVPFAFSPDNKYIAHFGFINPRTDKRGLMVNGKLVDGFALQREVPVFTPDSKHVFYHRPVSGASELCVDGKPAVKYSGIPLPQNQEAMWEMSAEGVYTFLAVVDGTVKRFRVTPPADTSVATLIADAEAAEAKLVADAAAAKKKADDELAARKQKAIDDKAAADAKAKADAEARKKKLDDDRAAAAAKAKAAADARAKAAADAAAARAAKQKK